MAAWYLYTTDDGNLVIAHMPEVFSLFSAMCTRHYVVHT